MAPGDWFVLLGYLTGTAVFWLAWSRWLPKPPDVSPTARRTILLAGLVGGVLGAKLIQWLLLGWPFLPGSTAAIAEAGSGGRTIIAGVICGWVCVEIAKWRLKVKVSTGDPFALALPAGEAIGRIGCHFNQCCYGVGIGHNPPWFAVYQHEQWRLPAQLVAAAVSLLIFAVLFSLRRRMGRQGDLFRLYLVLWGLGRLLVEFIRQRDSLYFGLSLAQWVSVELVLVGLLTLLLPRLLARSRLPSL